ncbi:MAG: tetratricopeptide repeat protein [Verrucomicrobiota bacterium]
MTLPIRIVLYGLLVMLMGYSLTQFRKAYSSQGGARHEAALVGEEAVESAQAQPATTDPQAPGTNAVSAPVGGLTNALATSVVPSTGVSTPSTTGASTNGVSLEKPASRKDSASGSVPSLGLFVISLLGLGGLVAWDVSRYLGGRSSKGMMAEDWLERKDPEYEKAEEVWANGQHLDAIALMREYLARNPREQHVAIRIAEIYEKDLGNSLAAALELEEVLPRKLPREKWGWTAVRLSNLYSGRLNQPEKALQLLERIVNEYPETGAAKKARQRLGLPEPEVAVESVEEESDDEGSDESPPPPPEPPSGLPKGFRPRG